MAVSNFTIKISGTVAYADNSHGSFESTSNWMGSLGVISQHNTADSQFHFNQLIADKSDDVNSMLAALPGSVGLSPGVSLPDKTVESFIMEISGVVSYDDNTQGLFLVQWVAGVVNVFPDENNEHWAALAAPGSDTASFLDQVFESLAGEDGATINQEGATATATMRPTSIPVVVARGSGYTTSLELTVAGGTFSTAAAVIVSQLSTVAGQDESNYGGGEFIGSFTPGSGYNADDTITLSDGTVVTVVAAGVTGGDVLQFTITSASTAGSGNGAALTQTGTSGGGTGFALAQGTINQGVFAANLKQISEVPVGEYTVLPTDPVSASENGHSGATFNIDWGVRNVTVVDGGTGYLAVPEVSFVGDVGGGEEAGAIAVLTVEVVTAVTVTSPGGGYTARADVVIAAP